MVFNLRDRFLALVTPAVKAPEKELIDLGAPALDEGIDIGPHTPLNVDEGIDLGAEEIPQPAPQKVIPHSDKLNMLFGDWVALVRHHSTHTHGNNCRIEITRPIQTRLWEEYNISSSPFHARDIGKILPRL